LGRTIIEILPLALAASISPSGLLLVMAILSGKEDPKRKALEFVLGATVFMVALGLVILLSFNPAISQAKQPGRASALIDIGLGVLIVLVVAHSVFFKKKAKQEKQKKHKRPFFVIGFLFMIVNTSTLIPFIAACKIIADNKLRLAGALISFLFLLAITMSLIALPVVITYLMPRSAEKLLAPLKSFMSKHGTVIAQAFFFAIAIYLIVHGALALRG
jgi:cytochrome c biogenesis protein CcdA